ncbi:MAG: hypothetical protein RLN72_05840 [Henriciella sp.]
MTRTNHLTRLAGASLALASLSACVNLTPDAVYPIGAVAALDSVILSDPAAPAEATIRTAKPGDILFQQAVMNRSVLTLQNTVLPEGNISLAVQARTVELNEGMTFYPALNIGSRNELVACSFDRPAEWTPRLNPGAKGSGKVCFILDDLGDKVEVGSFDPELTDNTSSTFFFVADGVGVTTQSTPYQRMFRWDPQLTYTVTEPARFSLSGTEAPDASAPQIGLRYVSTAKDAQIEPVYLIEGQPNRTIADPFVIAPDAKFPLRTKIAGAEIELLALKDGVLAYRILSGVSPGAFQILDLPQ